MPGLYNGINNLSDNELRIQLALFKNLTMINYAKETGNRFLGGLTELANAFTEAFTHKTPFDYQVLKVTDVIEKDILTLSGKEREQLLFELKDIIIKRYNELTTNYVNTDVSEDKLSLLIISEAAKTYHIDAYLSPGRLIDEIKKNYYKDYLKTLHTILIKQDETEQKKTDLAIQKRLNEVSLETKRELQRRLMPKEFSGKGVGRILRLENSVKYLNYSIELLGTECFKYIDCNVMNIFNTVKTLKRLTRVLLAELVWKAASTYELLFEIPSDSLPGYIQQAKREEFYESEKVFRSLLEQRKRTEKNLDRYNELIEKTDKQIVDVKDKYELETREYDEAQLNFMSLESKKDEYINGRHSQDETKQYYAEVNKAKRHLDSAEYEYNRWKNRLNELSVQKAKSKEEYDKALKEFEIIKKKTENDIIKFSAELSTKWRAYYKKLKFGNQVFARVVISFTHEEQLRVEEMLKEMQDVNELSVFSRETKATEDKSIIDAINSDKYYIAYVTVGQTGRAYISYYNNYIIEIGRTK